nr:hypothetical protein Hi04_10k_c3807_00024 [uncultured bacterium]
MENLSDMGEVRGGVLTTLSRFVQESPEATQRALRGALPTATYAVAEYGSTEAGAGTLLDGFANNRLPTPDVEGLGRQLSEPDTAQRAVSESHGFLRGILGDRMGPVVDALASQCGVSNAAMSKIFAVAAPLALGAIGRRARADNLDARGLAMFLSQQKAQVARMVPAGIGGVLGVASSAPSAEPVRVPSRPAVRETDPVVSRPGARWGWALAALAAIIAVVALMGRGNRQYPAVQGRNTAPSQRGGETGNEGTFKDRLNGYLSGDDPAPRRFVMKDSYVNDLSAAMLSHPGTHLTIEGFSSETGAESALKRANDLKDQLVKKGVQAQRVETDSRVTTTGDRLEVVVKR